MRSAEARGIVRDVAVNLRESSCVRRTSSKALPAKKARAITAGDVVRGGCLEPEGAVDVRIEVDGGALRGHVRSLVL